MTYSPGEHARRVPGLAARRRPAGPSQVVLADNGSTDGAPERAAADRPNVGCCATGGNLGYGAGRQRRRRRRRRRTGSWSPTPTCAGSRARSTRCSRRPSRWPRAGALGPADPSPGRHALPVGARSCPRSAAASGTRCVGWWWPSNPWTAAYRRERGAPVERPAGWLSGSVPAAARGPRSRPSAASTRRTSCTSRTSTWATGSAGPAGRTSTSRPRSSHHKGAASTSSDPRSMAAAHHGSAYATCPGGTRDRRWLPVRLVLRAGLAAGPRSPAGSAAVAAAARPTPAHRADRGYSPNGRTTDPRRGRSTRSCWSEGRAPGCAR